jgi:hypothetical protein
MLVLSQPTQAIRGLRWKFEYTDKPAKYGGWDYTGDDPSLQAWRQSKENLLFAVLEAKDHNQIIHRIFECSGADFCNFQWEMETSISFSGRVGTHRQVGMTLVSRTQRATFYKNGKSEISDRPISDLDNHYLYGKV